MAYGTECRCHWCSECLAAYDAPRYTVEVVDMLILPTHEDAALFLGYGHT